jgi:hypothetical protein
MSASARRGAYRVAGGEGGQREGVGGALDGQVEALGQHCQVRPIRCPSPQVCRAAFGAPPPPVAHSPPSPQVGSIAVRLNTGLVGSAAVCAALPFLPATKLVLMLAVALLGTLGAIALSSAYQLVQSFRHAGERGGRA